MFRYNFGFTCFFYFLLNNNHIFFNSCITSYCVLITGLTTSGFHACPYCGDDLSARHSTSLQKMVYDNHVRYLPENHHMCRRGSRKGHPKRVARIGYMFGLKVMLDLHKA